MDVAGVQFNSLAVEGYGVLNMRSRVHFRSFTVALLLVGLVGSQGSAEITQKLGFFNKVPGGQLFQCPQGMFLLGLTQNQTDRIVGISYVCGTAVRGGKWTGVDSLVVPPQRLGDFSKGSGK